MSYTQDHTWQNIGTPCVTTHDDGTIHMHSAGYMYTHGNGFCIEFNVNHLDMLDDIVARLMVIREADQLKRQGRGEDTMSYEPQDGDRVRYFPSPCPPWRESMIDAYTMTDLKLLDELLVMMKPDGQSWREFDRTHSHIVTSALARLRGAWATKEMDCITLSLARYFEVNP